MTRWREIADADVQQVVSLWERCKLTRPWNDPVTDIAFARRGPASTVLVWDAGGTVVAAVMVGHDGHRGALYYLGVDPAHQAKGLGSQVLDVAEEWLRQRGVWKINIQVRGDNAQAISFYEKLGFTANAVVSLGKTIRRTA